jgi:YidC/Oxa1 family membrane protein insertase
MWFSIYQTILYQPLFNFLIFLYNIIPGKDIGLAIIFLTIVVRLILWPFFGFAIKSQRALQLLQPKVEEIKKKYNNDKEKMAPALVALYGKEKINPTASCLPLLIQMPILIAVYQVFRKGLASNGFELLYSFINNPGHIETMAFNLVDLAVPSWPLAVLAAIAQFWQTWMMMKRVAPIKKELTNKDNQIDPSAMAQQMSRQMTYLMPLVTIWIGTKLPGGLALYWLVMTLVSALQQLVLIKKTPVKSEEVKSN